MSKYITCKTCKRHSAKMFVFAPLGPSPADVRVCRYCDKFLFDYCIRRNQESMI